MTILTITKHFAVAFLTLASDVVVAGAGDFDPSFNQVGFTRDFIANDTRNGGLAIHSTGEIVTNGSFGNLAFEHLVLWRHLPNGTLDTTFGGTRIVYLPQPPGIIFGDGSLAIDNQNRLVLVVPLATAHVLYRINFDGSLDLSFSGTGSVTIPLGLSVFGIAGVAIQPDKKIVGAGGTINPASNRWEFVVYRVEESGGLDPSFGSTGLIYTPMTPGGGVDRATGVAVQPDGNIVVAGRARTLMPCSYFDIALARYLPTGALDQDFGTGGKVIFSVLDDDFGRKLVIQRDGKILVAGSICQDLGGGDSYCYLGAARVDAGGALDPSFGDYGRVYTDVGDLGGSAYDIALQSDNRILVAGAHQAAGDFRIANAILIRYQPDGSLDPAFGLNGISETNYGYAANSAGTVRVQSDGKIVVSGITFGRSGSAVTARYLASDNTFFRAARTALQPTRLIDMGRAELR